MASTGEFANIVSAVYDYLDSGSAAAAYLKTCMLAADHDILYVPDGVPAPPKSMAAGITHITMLPLCMPSIPTGLFA